MISYFLTSSLLFSRLGASASQVATEKQIEELAGLFKTTMEKLLSEAPSEGTPPEKIPEASQKLDKCLEAFASVAGSTPPEGQEATLERAIPEQKQQEGEVFPEPSQQQKQPDFSEPLQPQPPGGCWSLDGEPLEEDDTVPGELEIETKESLKGKSEGS